MTKKAALQTSRILTYTGLAIWVGWIILMVVINNTYLRNNLGLILFPIASGIVLLSIGLSSDIKKLAYRILFIVVSTIALSYLSYWVLAFLIIGMYRLGA